jgi:hypothetical protein
MSISTQEKTCTSLSLVQVASYLPEETKHFYNTYKKQSQPIRQKIADIISLKLEPALELILIFQIVSQNRETLSRYLKLYKTMKFLDSDNRIVERYTLNIQKAREVPIKDLYQFDKLRPMGRNFKASCPFHSDNTPSFVIYNNKFKCFSCGEAGSSIDFYMKLHNKSFKDAVKDLS